LKKGCLLRQPFFVGYIFSLQRMKPTINSLHLL
jgi:hypothetical protein